MTAMDPKSSAGKFPLPAQRVQLAVVGAGPAGLAAALAGAAAGLSVLLVDENPVDGGLIGQDVPLLYGGRATAAVGRPQRLLQRMLDANPALAEAVEQGIDVQLSTSCWGCFANGPNLQALPGVLLGLADAGRSWMAAAEQVVLATGARDLALGFPGAELPGVMGAQALAMLLDGYDAFAGRRAVVLGGGQMGIEAALRLQARGIAVAAVVEARSAPPAAASLRQALAAAGVPLLCDLLPAEAIGGVDGVAALRLAAADGTAGPVLEADTIVLAVGRVPVVDLAQVAGCRLTFSAAHGGWVPVLDSDGRSSQPRILVAGDAAGLADPDATRMAGQRAGLAAAQALGRAVAPPERPASAAEGADDPIAYRLDWMRGLRALGGGDTLACRCEEVTRDELLGLRPPRYLDAAAPRPQGIAALQEGAPVHPDQVKRLTRAGMGPCQGRRCREQVAMLLSLATGTPLERIPLASYRAPVRPLPLQLLAEAEEPPGMAAHWEVWFGIHGQWVPWRDIGTPREVLDRYGEPADPGHL
jgi:thioredoxin reductase